VTGQRRATRPDEQQAPAVVSTADVPLLPVQHPSAAWPMQMLRCPRGTALLQPDGRHQDYELHPVPEPPERHPAAHHRRAALARSDGAPVAAHQAPTRPTQPVHAPDRQSSGELLADKPEPPRRGV
jgi:hypothetical protein